MNGNGAKIIVRRYEYEEPQNTQLEFIISNGQFSSTVDFYCEVKDIKEIGKALISFPTRIDDEYCYSYGSKDNYYRFFLIRAYTTDGVGHCAIQFKINLNEEEPLEGESLFSLRAEAAAINKLGKLFIEFSKLEHKEFHWSPNDHSELFETHQKVH